MTRNVCLQLMKLKDEGALKDVDSEPSIGHGDQMESKDEEALTGKGVEVTIRHANQMQSKDEGALKDVEVVFRYGIYLSCMRYLIPSHWI